MIKCILFWVVVEFFVNVTKNYISNFQRIRKDLRLHGFDIDVLFNVILGKLWHHIDISMCSEHISVYILMCKLEHNLNL